MKVFNLKELVSKSKSSKIQKKIDKARQDKRYGIRFICKKLRRNINQYFCDEICKQCKTNKID